MKKIAISKRSYLSEISEIEHHLSELSTLLGEGYYSTENLIDDQNHIHKKHIDMILAKEESIEDYENQVAEIRRILHLYVGSQERRRELYAKKREAQKVLGGIYNAIGSYYYKHREVSIGSYTIVEELLGSIDKLDEKIEDIRADLKLSSWQMMSRSLFRRLRQKKYHGEIQESIDDYGFQREELFQRLGEQICAAKILDHIIGGEKGEELKEQYQKEQILWDDLQQQIEANSGSIQTCLCRLSAYPVEEPFERSIRKILWKRDTAIEERRTSVSDLGWSLYKQGVPEELRSRQDLSEIYEKIENLKRRESQVFQMLNSHNMTKEQHRLERMLDFNYEQLMVKDYQTQTLQREMVELERENRQIRKRIEQIRQQMDS